ncbi:hypothetical protein O181_011930 [Austropuccinia psidii MF-1]|uniref:Reverse transcriptase/retrotransposon-derived protein RNase H-like domain-containing protein n=1 Tax=Austropuccinia psidii MF-1 TaxID=1389203 RepID=A0A9Q3BWV9_9BASI|nr:hypothetical protein [Austropuccinia psidii MF-1]
MVELLSFPSFEWDVLVIDTLKGEELILSFYFLNPFNPYINWRKGLINFNADHKDYYDSSNCFGNEFSSSKSYAAVVGDSRTPSFPSSFHIPSLNSHTSLLSSRDEVLKETQDLWDEEEEPEEIETVMKVVPSAYHQYLDVFSKVKSEKLPPCWACDHHLKLEESLPPEAIRQLHELKKAFTTSPILSHFNPSLPTILETDSSEYALGPVLSKVSNSGKYPISFDSCKLLPEELNYEIHDKELLGIVCALKCWRAFLLSLSSSFEALTNHASLQYFMLSKIVTWPQARWAELSGFHFSITNLHGHLATLPDAFSLQENLDPERGEDLISKNTMYYQKIIKQDII